MDRTQAEDVGEHVLCQGKMEDAAMRGSETDLPLVQFEQQVGRAFVGVEPS